MALLPTILGAIAGETFSFAAGASGNYIVGEADDTVPHAVLWDALNPTDAPIFLGAIPGQISSSATAVFGTSIIGFADDGATHAVLWDATNPTVAPTMLGTIPGQTGSQAFGLDGTYIVGYAVDGSSPGLAAVWLLANPTATPASLGSFGGSVFQHYAYAVTGTYIAGYGLEPSAIDPFLWDATNPTAPPTEFGETGTSAQAVGADGTNVVGNDNGTAALWDATNPTALPTVLGAIPSQVSAGALAILGAQIVGQASDGQNHAVLWDAANPTVAPTILQAILDETASFATALTATYIVGEADDTQGHAVMWAPSLGHAVAIKIAGTNYTSDAVYATASFDAAVNGANGTCKFRVRDETSSLLFVTGDRIELLVDNVPTWTGYLTKQVRVYAFPAENVVAAGLTRWLDIEGVDLNILFSRRIAFNASDPATVLIPPTAPYPPHTADLDAINDLTSNYIDLSGDDIDVTTLVESVGDINEDQDARPYSGGDTFGTAMTLIAALPGAVFFIQPRRKLVYTDANTASAPFPMSDQPTGDAVGYREMTISADGTGLINDYLGVGIGYGSNTPVADREIDATSLSTHGRWQAGSP